MSKTRRCRKRYYGWQDKHIRIVLKFHFRRSWFSRLDLLPCEDCGDLFNAQIKNFTLERFCPWCRRPQAQPFAGATKNTPVVPVVPVALEKS
jgi:hypothetical protein